jgi:hypothetical protein
MKAKEKAKELVFRFGKIDHINNRCLPFKQAKQCALIAVDEIMKSGCTQPSSVAYYGDNEEAIRYWESVKQEIKKL